MGGAIAKPILTTYQSVRRFHARDWFLAVLVRYTASSHAVNNGRSARAGLLFHAFPVCCMDILHNFKTKSQIKKEKDFAEVLPSLA